MLAYMDGYTIAIEKLIFYHYTYRKDLQSAGKSDDKPVSEERQGAWNNDK